MTKRQLVKTKNMDGVMDLSSPFSWVSNIFASTQFGLKPAYRSTGVANGLKWVSTRAEKEACLVHADNQGTLHIPELGLAIETWFFHNGQLDMPDNHRPLYQRPLAYYGVNSSIGYSGGTCNIVLFPITELAERFAAGVPKAVGGRLIGVEYRIHGRDDLSLNEMMILFVVRSFHRNGPFTIRQMEYRKNYLWINKKPLIHFPESPGHCFFIDGQPQELAEYFWRPEGNSRVVSSRGNCTGLIGYSGLAAELHETAFYINFSPKARIIQGGYSSFLKTGSNLLWQERYSRQSGMIDAGDALNELISGTFPHLIAFSGLSGETISPFLILTLNRWGLYGESRNLLEQAIHTATWLNWIRCRSTCCRLPFLIDDYVRFSGDAGFIRKHRNSLQTVGNWLVYTSGFGLRKYTRTKNPFQNEEALWFCASLKAMASLAKIMDLNHESVLYREQYIHFRLQMLHHIQETFLRVEPYRLNRPSVREWMNVLAGISPFNLWEKEEEWVKSVVGTVCQDFCQMGGVAAPSEFNGINLRYTAALGRILLQMGMNYRPILEFLYEAGTGGWNWPDIIDPVSRAGMGKFEHDPETLFQVLVMVRNLFAIEDDNVLELFPGFSNQGISRSSRLSIRRFPTRFGDIESDFLQVGSHTEINLEPNFWKRPSVIRIRRNDTSSLTFCDAWVRENPGYWEFGPELRRIRFKSSAAVDVVS